MFSKGKWILAGLLVVGLFALGVGSMMTWAQSPTPTPPKTWNDLYLQSLAQKLGTTVEKLQQAMTDARKDAAMQGVKQGILTQPQADRMLGTTVRGTNASAQLDAAAKALGMSTTDLTTALRGGKTLLELAREKNVDVTKLRTAIADAEKAAIDQAVKDGKLTQAQSDTLKTRIKPENIDLNRRGIAGSQGVGRAPMQSFGGRGLMQRFSRQVPGQGFMGRGSMQQFNGRMPGQGSMGRFDNRSNGLPQNRAPRGAPPQMPQFWR